MPDLFEQEAPQPAQGLALRRPEPTEAPLTDMETSVYRLWAGWPTRSMDFGMRRLMRRWVREAVADSWRQEHDDDAWRRAALRLLAWAPDENTAGPHGTRNAP